MSYLIIKAFVFTTTETCALIHYITPTDQTGMENATLPYSHGNHVCSVEASSPGR
jgi:hypothetical protein